MRIYRIIIHLCASLVNAILLTNHAFAQQAYRHTWFHVGSGRPVNWAEEYT